MASQDYSRFRREIFEKIERVKLAEALKAGFSSYEEFENDTLMKERERNAEWAKRIEEETGMTVEEYWATHPQREKTPLEFSSQCDCHQPDCQDHLIPRFCPESLVDYRSQDQPVLVGFFQAKTDQEIRNLKIDPNSKSRRLSQDTLEQYWERDIRGAPPEWPPWLKGDSVLHRIEQQGEHDDIQKTFRQLQEQSKRYFEAGTGHDTSPSIFTEDRSDVEMSDITKPSTPTSTFSSEEIPLIKASDEQEIRECRAPDSSVQSKKFDDIQITPQRTKPKHKTANTSRSQLRRPSNVSKNKTPNKRQRGKGVVKCTRRTRSQNVTKFYELKIDGTATTYRKYG